MFQRLLVVVQRFGFVLLSHESFDIADEKHGALEPYSADVASLSSHFNFRKLYYQGHLNKLKIKKTMTTTTTTKNILCCKVYLVSYRNAEKTSVKLYRNIH